MKYFLFLILIFPMTVLAQLPEVSSGVYEWDKLPARQNGLRTSRKIMEGSSPHFEFLEVHATTQEAGAKPAPPHTQKDIEEILIVKEGSMKFTMNQESKILNAGSVIVIPPLAEQSLENVGDGPLTYYVFMFRSKKPMNIQRSTDAGGAMMLDRKDLEFKTNAKGGRINYFDRPTAMCEKLEMHVTQLNLKGPSHVPHTHIDSEFIILTEGTASMHIDGKEFLGKAGDLFLMKSNELHGISNTSDEPCKYFAFRWY